MTLNDVISFAELAIKANNPLVTIPSLFLIVFLGYGAAKKFFDTGYIAITKETREGQHQLNGELQKEIERLNKRIEQLCTENDNLTQKLSEKDKLIKQFQAASQS